MVDLEQYLNGYKRKKTELDIHWRQRFLPESRIGGMMSIQSESNLLQQSRMGDQSSVGNINSSQVSIPDSVSKSIVRQLNIHSPQSDKQTNFTNQISPTTPLPCLDQESRRSGHPVLGPLWEASPLGLSCLDTNSVKKQQAYYKYRLFTLTNSNNLNHTGIPVEICTGISPL